MKIPFKRKPYHCGDSHVVSIPRAFITGGMIDPTQQQTFYIEVPDHEQTNKHHNTPRTQ